MWAGTTTQRRAMSRTIGDLTPVLKALDEIDRRIEAQAQDRPDDDPGVLALKGVRKVVADALDDAVRPIEGLTIEEYAARENITVFGAYKRVSRGQVPAQRRGGRIVIPTSAIAA